MARTRRKAPKQSSIPYVVIALGILVIGIGVIYPALIVYGAPTFSGTNFASLQLSVNGNVGGQLCGYDITGGSPQLSQCTSSSLTITNYNVGDQIKLSMIPSNGYSFSSLTVNGQVVLQAGNSGPSYYYTIQSLQRSIQASASFTNCSNGTTCTYSATSTISLVTVTIGTVQPSGGNGQICIYKTGTIGQNYLGQNMPVCTTSTSQTVTFSVGDPIWITVTTGYYFPFDHLTVNGQTVITQSQFNSGTTLYLTSASSGLTATAYFIANPTTTAPVQSTYTSCTTYPGVGTGGPYSICNGGSTTQNPCTLGYPYNTAVQCTPTGNSTVSTFTSFTASCFASGGCTTSTFIGTQTLNGGNLYGLYAAQWILFIMGLLIVAIGIVMKFI